MNTHSPVNGATYLTLGVLSLILCPALGPVAWSMSNNALDVLDKYENGGEAGQRGLIVAGRTCGIVGTAFFALFLVALLLRGCAVPGHG